MIARWVLLGLLTAALSVAGCGGDDEAGSGGGGGTATTKGWSGKLEVPTSPQTEIPVDEPLKAKAAKKKLTFLQNELPTSAIDAEGYKAGAKALGWDFDIVNIKTTAPGPGFQQAIDSGTDFIALEALPLALFANQAKAAKAAGIPILSCFAQDPPDPEGTGIYTQCAGEGTIQNQARDMARWAINDARGKAKVVLVNLRDIPILVAEEDEWKKTIDADCPDCSFDVIPITAEALGKGSVPQLVTSYLQQHPDTTHVAFAFGDPANGVPEALASSGLDKDVKIVGINATKANLQQMVDGKAAAFTMQPVDYTGWSVVDLAARIATDTPLGELATADVPTYVLDSKKTAQEYIDAKGYWPGPEGFEERFLELWKAG